MKDQAAKRLKRGVPNSGLTKFSGVATKKTCPAGPPPAGHGTLCCSSRRCDKCFWRIAAKKMSGRITEAA